MKIEIRNYRGIERADFDVRGITLIGAINYQGKSSICEAVGAALARQPIPKVKAGKEPGKFTGRLSKGKLGLFVKDGTKKGHVAVSGEAGSVKITWPDGEISTDGKAPGSSVFAAGMMSPFDLPDDPRYAYFSDLLKVSPAFADLAAALTDAGMKNADFHKRIWKSVEENGWDLAAKIAKDAGAKSKGAWEEATGENWGVDKARSWLPTPWSDAWLDETPESMHETVEAARSMLHLAIAESALGADELRKIEETAARKPPEPLLLDRRLATANTALTDAVQARDKLPRADDLRDALQCPHCSKAVIYRASKLEKAVQLSADEMKTRRAAIQKAQAIVDARQKEVDGAAAAVAAANREINEIADAKAKLTDARSRKGGAAQVAIEQIKVDAAEAALKSREAYDRATKAMKAVAASAMILQVLAPDGVRRQTLQRAVAEFNKELNTLCSAVGLSAVSLDDNMEPEYQTRPYVMLSESEQYLVNAVVRISIAKREGADLIIMDRADVFMKEGRNALLGMLLEADIPCIMAMSVNLPSVLPDMQKVGGITYWVEGGILMTLAEAVAREGQIADAN